MSLAIILLTGNRDAILSTVQRSQSLTQLSLHAYFTHQEKSHSWQHVLQELASSVSTKSNPAADASTSTSKRQSKKLLATGFANVVNAAFIANNVSTLYQYIPNP